MKKSILFALSICSLSSFAQTIQVNYLGRYTDGREVACEISTYNKEAQKLYVTNAAADSIDIVDVKDITKPIKVGQIDVLSYGGGVNSVVSLEGGFLAAAIEADPKTDSGFVVFYDTAGTFVSKVKVGSLPDMVAVTHDGKKVLVANEGEPSDDYLTDPEGSVSIIDISGGVENLSQSNVTNLRLDGAPSSISGSIRKPGVAWEKDLEPEYIAIAEDDSKAFVICQESNVLLVIDIENASVESFNGLGFKDHSSSGNGLDASNKDNGINITNWNVKGVYQPDAIATYSIEGKSYIVSANEGDGRDYSGYSWETRIKDLMLDTLVFPDFAILQEDSNLGRLTTFTDDVIGDTDNDGYVEELYCYGGRSFSIWDENGDLIFDSGDEFESYIKDNFNEWFNCNDGEKGEFDARSDDKGPEPEAVAIGKLRSEYFAFIGLERQGGIMVYNITDPMSPTFETYIEEFDEGTGIMTDIAPEGLLFVNAEDNHTGKNLLIVSNEVSGTTSIYEIEDLFVGQAELSVENEWVIYPNPTTASITLKSNGSTNNRLFEISDILGNQVMEGKVNSLNQLIDLNSFSKGLYFISIKESGSDNVFLTQKIIKN